MNKYQHGAYSLIAILFVVLISVASLVALRKLYADSSYRQEADIISQRVLAFSADANFFTSNNYDCRMLHNAYMITNGLVPKEWEYDVNEVGIGIDALIGIHYKYGNINISSNLTPSELPSANIGPYDGYRITMYDYPSIKMPRFLDQIINEFDFIKVNNTVVKGETGINEQDYITILNNGSGVSTITLVNWGC